MTLPAIRPVHRPEVPADLRDDDFPVAHLDDATTLSHIEMTDVTQAAEHFRQRFRQAAGQDLCHRLLATIPLPDDRELDEITRNVLTLRGHMHIKHDYGPRIDWTTVLDDDIESNVAINQQPHLASLALAYQRTGDERYAAHAVETLRSWFDQSPAPSKEARLQWRTLEVAGRLTHAWPLVGVCLCDYPGLTDRDVFDLIRWTWMSVRHLRRFVGPPNNWLQIESIAAILGLTLLREPTVADGWLKLFWRRLDWINDHQFLPDGMQAENSPGYHLFPWWRLYSVGVWIQLFGGSLPPGYWQQQIKRAQPLWMLRQPDGTLPALSDCGPQPTRATRQLDFVRWHQPQAHLPDPDQLAMRSPVSRPSLKPRASAGVVELPDDHRICHLPYAGYTVCRTGWDANAEYLLFDHGYYGTNHQHEDKLTFLYGNAGRMLIGDAGIYRYSRDAWEQYFRGAPATTSS